jgi:hypothetical protein
MKITMQHIIDAGKMVVRLAAQYGQKDYHKEMRLDGMLWGILECRHGRIERQHRVTIGRTEPRIDFRQNHKHPVFLEFAVRTPGKNQLYGSQNRGELHKLERQKGSLRALLLLDLSGRPAIPQENMRKTYAKQASGRGRYTRYPVQVFYVHPTCEYRFTWRPRS